MSALDPTVLRWLRQHHSTASISELVTLGVTRDQVRHLVREGVLVAVHRGVYLLAGAPLHLAARARAACAADPDVVVARVSAGRVWGHRRLPTHDAVQLVGPDGTSARAGWDLQRCSVLEEEDIVIRDDGIRVTSPPRTVFDLAAVLPPDALESVIEQTLDQYCRLITLWRTAERLTAPGRPGSARFVATLSSRAGWQRPAASDLELRVLRALERRGIELVRQYRLVTGIGPIHLDGADPAIKWGVEVDHVTWHGGRTNAQRDKARDRAARRVGWQVERVGDVELAASFDAVIDELADLHTQRRRDFQHWAT